MNSYLKIVLVLFMQLILFTGCQSEEYSLSDILNERNNVDTVTIIDTQQIDDLVWAALYSLETSEGNEVVNVAFYSVSDTGIEILKDNGWDDYQTNSYECYFDYLHKDDTYYHTIYGIINNNSIDRIELSINDEETIEVDIIEGSSKKYFIETKIQQGRFNDIEYSTKGFIDDEMIGEYTYSFSGNKSS